MGSPDGEGDEDERPQHRVCLEAFQMGRYEVTVAEYDAFARASGRFGGNPVDGDGYLGFRVLCSSPIAR